MLKFHIIIIKFSIFTNKNSQSDTFFPKLKNTIVKIDIKSFSVWLYFQYEIHKKRLFMEKTLINLEILPKIFILTDNFL